MNKFFNRRNFISGLGAAIVSGIKPAFAEKPDGIRSVLLHWGLNMWGESLPPDIKGPLSHGRLCNDRVKFSDKAWNALVADIIDKRMNMVVIDLGEFPVYPSHPEIALPGSRSPDWIRNEVRRLKRLGLEPIPKLNFSSSHDSWLGEYSRMLTTGKYYEVCRDLIRDVAEMFDHPRLFHIGYDEESAEHQRGFKCVRVDEVWWHDLNFFVKVVEQNGMRPWMWSDYGWRHDEFVDRCPKSVLQSNWYYINRFDMSKMDVNEQDYAILRLFQRLDKAGFDQVPCGSNWTWKNGPATNRSVWGLVKFCRSNVSPKHLKGFMMAPWADCTDSTLKLNLEGIDFFAQAL